jgi:hypothetical protein
MNWHQRLLYLYPKLPLPGQTSEEKMLLAEKYKKVL